MGRTAKATAAVMAALLALGLVPLPVLASDPAPGVPPDGPAGPVRSLSDLKRAVPLWTEVTTQTVTVQKVACTGCESPTAPADFWVSDGKTTLRVHEANTWQPTYNVKKQNFVPAVGSHVVVQGRLQPSGGERFIEMKRFGERDHPGPTLHAYDVAAGKLHGGAYAWLAPARVLNVARWDDGDYTFDLRDPAGGGLVHVELTPPFNGQLRIPNRGELVQPYGMVHFDADHGWWELHPVRCWSAGECVPISASYVRNGPPAGTPRSGGYYLQGGPVPLWVPRTGTSTALTATFKPSPNSNDWWVQVTVTASKPLAEVDAQATGGPWVRLDHAWWGDWTKSMHVPAGSKVTFRAVATDGSTATSGAFAWPP
jgi:hypothetical protein